MKYVKAEAPFALKDGKKTLIQVFDGSNGKAIQNREYLKAAMLSPTESDKMVLLADAKALLPYPSRGAILSRSHSVNLAGTKEILMHPEVFDHLVEQGVLSVDGVALKVAAKAERREAEKTEAAPKEETTSDLDVNNDGVVDANDVKIVAEAAAESLEKGDGQDGDENGASAGPAND